MLSLPIIVLLVRTETKGNILKRVDGIVNRDRKKRCPFYARKASWVPHFSLATFFNGCDSVMVSLSCLVLFLSPSHCSIRVEEKGLFWVYEWGTLLVKSYL